MQNNILFIMADQFRWDAIGKISGWMRTPYIDSLIDNGAVFSNAFATSVECVPSRLSLATGLYPHQFGIKQNTPCALNSSFPNWMQAVEKVGYETSLFGKTHLHPHVGDIRFRQHLLHAYGLQIVDETTGPRACANVLSNMTAEWAALGLWDNYRADLQDRFRNKPFEARPSSLPLEHFYDVYVGQTACRYLSDRKKDRPFFCWVSFGGPHEPWDAPEPYASMYDPAQAPAPLPRIGNVFSGLLKRKFENSDSRFDINPADVAKLRANYAGNVSLIDDQIGNIINSLKKSGEYERTLIVFTSDHGEMNGDHGVLYKSNFLDPALRVPLIISLPTSNDVLGVDPARKQSERRPKIIPEIVELPDVGATIADFAGAELPKMSNAKSLRSLLGGSQDKPRDAALSEYAEYAAIISPEWKLECVFDNLEPTLLIDRINDRSESMNLVDRSEYRDVVADLRIQLDRKINENLPITGVIDVHDGRPASEK